MKVILSNFEDLKFTFEFDEIIIAILFKFNKSFIKSSPLNVPPFAAAKI